jgi:hypothetical protein
MLKRILLLLGETQSSNVARELAFNLARRLEVNLTGPLRPSQVAAKDSVYSDPNKY